MFFVEVCFASVTQVEEKEDAEGWRDVSCFSVWPSNVETGGKALLSNILFFVARMPWLPADGRGAAGVSR